MQLLGPIVALEPVITWGGDTAGWHTVRGAPVRLFGWLGELPAALGRARRLMVSDVRTIAPVTEIFRYASPEGPATVAAYLASGVFAGELARNPKLPRGVVLAILRDLAEALAWVQGPEPVCYGATLGGMRVGFDGVTRLELSVERPPPEHLIINFFSDASDAFPEETASGPADLWRLGVLAAELTHGNVFSGREPRAVEPSLLEGLGPAVRRLLEPDPRARPTAAELAKALKDEVASADAVASVVGELFAAEKRAHLEHIEELRAQLPRVEDSPPVEILAALS